MTTQELQAVCRQVRRDIVEMTTAAASGHPGGSLSAVELTVGAFYHAMRVDPANPHWEDRDRFVLSKGHVSPCYYGVLAEKGFFPREELKTFRQLHSRLQGHPDAKKLPGVDASTGSLGQGVSIANGMALGAKLLGKDTRVFVLCGDGELQEGQNYEAMMAMRSFSLSNLTPIVDYNRVQLDGTNDEIQPNQTALAERLAGFGLTLFMTDGHDEAALRKTLAEARACSQPHIVIANTIKGKGVSFMEGKSAWHGKPITKEEYEAACAELKGGRTL